MTDLTDEQKDALIEALENNDEILTGSIDPPGPPFLWEYGGATNWFLTPAGRLLAQAYKRILELEKSTG